jgi:hypothetical protein
MRDDEQGNSKLFKAIAKRYGHCEAIRTHQLVDRVFVGANGERTVVQNVTVVNGKQYLEISQMRIGELVNYVKERKYSIETNLYPHTDDLKRAILEYETDKEAFLASQDTVREENRIKKDAEALEFLSEDEEEAPLDI